MDAAEFIDADDGSDGPGGIDKHGELRVSPGKHTLKFDSPMTASVPKNFNHEAPAAWAAAELAFSR